ncbi:LLM class flavin-dependent oxidoreductase [Kitasatospora sp. NPDC101801]|uniref:LLM class flavin-dependent oxidoreductase n=1 Tax=Kitasatospora sp. NPDC101801 TaxID=3364103 RepID=UPI003809FC36
MTPDFEVYATARTARPGEPHGLAALREISRAAEAHGVTGLLAFYNHRNPDPWLVASAVLGCTDRLVPLVAAQPYAAPPFTVAQLIHTLTTLYGRRVDLNLITGATGAELRQVGETADGEERYRRAAEYVTVVRRLLTEEGPVAFAGDHYRYEGLRMNTPLAPELLPRVFLAGSSPAALATARTVADVAITHPEPVDRFAEDYARALAGGPRIGIRVGLLARPTAAEAWAVARETYRETRASRLTTAARRTQGSDWSRRLAVLATEGDVYDDVYWTGAYRSDKGTLPLLVGSYREVADYVARYHRAGARVLVLGNAGTAEDFRHAGAVFAELGGGSAAAMFDRSRAAVERR